MGIVEKIRDEIERRMVDNLNTEEAIHTGIFGAKAVEDNDLLAFIDGLKEE